MTNTRSLVLVLTLVGGCNMPQNREQDHDVNLPSSPATEGQQEDDVESVTQDGGSMVEAGGGQQEAAAAILPDDAFGGSSDGGSSETTIPTLSLTLAADSPSQTVSGNTPNFPVLKVTAAAGGGEVLVKELVFERVGGLDDQIRNVKCEGAEATKEYSRYRVVLNRALSAGQTTTLVVFADLNAKLSPAQFRFSLVEVKVESGEVVGLPVLGNEITATHTCKTQTVLHVPNECPTIQAALHVAQMATPSDLGVLTTILVSGGTYHENLNVVRTTHVQLSPDSTDEVVVDGGNQSALAVNNASANDLVYLSGLTFTSSADSTVYAAHLQHFSADGMTIRNTAGRTALKVESVNEVDVWSSTLEGIGSGLGMEWLDNFSGSLMYNKIKSVTIGVVSCQNAPSISFFGGDSNMYSDVGNNTIHAAVCE